MLRDSLPIRCKLPKGFLAPEIRSGYEVSAQRKRIWAVEIDLYLQFARICERHNIKFQVFAGTLLGAVRHKGFIPWDDDFDVAMTRGEYRKFLKVAQGELDHPYFLQTALTDRKYFLGYARLRNSETTGAISHFSSPNYNNGIYLDIYVLDGRAETPFQNFIQKKLRWLAIIILVASARYEDMRITARILYTCIRPLVSVFPYISRVRFYDWVMSMYGRNPKYWNQNTHGDNTYKYCITAKQWEDVRYIPFEWFSVPVPRDYAGVLSSIYGDYMRFPPVEKRGAWHDTIVHFEPDIPYIEYLSRRDRAFK